MGTKTRFFVDFCKAFAMEENPVEITSLARLKMMRSMWRRTLIAKQFVDFCRVSAMVEPRGKKSRLVYLILLSLGCVRVRAHMCVGNYKMN